MAASGGLYLFYAMAVAAGVLFGYTTARDYSLKHAGGIGIALGSGIIIGVVMFRALGIELHGQAAMFKEIESALWGVAVLFVLSWLGSAMLTDRNKQKVRESQKAKTAG